MGTRSLTVFQESNGKEIVVMYRQFDGYLSGHGADLKKFIGDMIVVNGLSGGDQRIANGMGCLAAQVVAHFKEEPGGFYLYPADTRGCSEEYIYTLYIENSPGLRGGVPIRVKVEGCYGEGVIFDGPISEFVAED